MPHEPFPPSPPGHCSCFLYGTRITTPAGEISVEALRIGDLVTVANGGTRPIKWIGHRAYHLLFAKRNAEVLPVRIRAGALTSGVPARDLLVSPRHGMLADGLLVHAIELVNGLSIVQEIDPPLVEYFHIELDQPGVIFAEGAPTESYVDCGNRHLFQNAHEYAELYGETEASANFCAPPIDGGPLADAVRARLAIRAGLPTPALTTTHGLLGFVDDVGETTVEGWAMDDEQRDIPLLLDVLENGRLLARTVADRYRPDLVASGMGPGRHGFRVTIPAAAEDRQIVVRRSLDGAALSGSNESREYIAA